jgi:pilus assembly protein CpaE
MSAIRALIALAEGITPGAVEAALPAADGIEVIEWVENGEPRQAKGGDRSADLVIVACSAKSASTLALIKNEAALEPERPVVVLQLDAAHSNGFMQDVFAAGADDIIALPETPERIRHALQKAIARKRGTTFAKGAVPARLVCVLGPKGGTGKTVTSCNLAVGLAEVGRRTNLVDLDLHFGDVGLGLRLAPERTIYDLVRSGGTLDAEKLDDYLMPHASGVRTLLAPTRPDHAGAIAPKFIGEVLAVLRSMSDVVVVDTSAGFPPEVITAIDSSTDVCVVGTLDAFSLKDTKLGLETLDRMGYDRDAIRLVLNRSDSHVGISSDDVLAILGRTPDVLVPNQRDIPRAITEGTPIVSAQPRSTAAKAFRKLAGMYAAEPASAPTAKLVPAHEARRKSLLRRA